MKRILCYGDSNTWGYMPGRGTRYPETVRWTGLLQARLGADYCVVEEGLSGRTTVWDDPYYPHMNGAAGLGMVLLSQFPLDLVILMLGTNDLKTRFGPEPYLIGEGIRRCIEVVRNTAALARKSNAELQVPEILVVSPIRIGEGMLKPPFSCEFEGPVTLEKSRALGETLRAVAASEGCDFLDAAALAGPSLLDGIHLEPEGHEALARGIHQHLTARGF